MAEGHKLAIEIILSRAFDIEQIYALPDWLNENDSLLKNIQYEFVTEIDHHSMKMISNLSTHSSVYILLKKPELKVKDSLINGKFSFLLQGVQDPGNVGTIIRIADWFGIPNVITDYNSADLLHPKVVQSSMGSICNVNLMRGSDEELLEFLSIYPSYALALDGEDLSRGMPNIPGLIMLGSEGKGLSPMYKSKATRSILIPPAITARADSLNVAVAAGIIAHSIRN